MRDVGMTGAELRVIWGRNAIELSDEELDKAREAVERHGMRVLSLASPLLKCVLPDAPPVDPRFQQDVFGSAYTFEDQPRLTRRAFEVAERTGARIIRVFSYWRTTEPERVFDRVASALRDLADQAVPRGIVIGLENEHACNVGTGAEAARLLAAVDHPALGLDLGPGKRVHSWRDAVPERLRHASARTNHPRAREGLRRQRAHGDLGAARRDAAGLEGTD